MLRKQVEKENYDFLKYIGKDRWASIWHQLYEVLRLKPDSVLEIGPGPGIFKALGIAVGCNIQTVDIDPDLKPDYLASADEMPFTDQAYDIVCAFEVLEHLPYDQALIAFKEMVRVARRGVIISLPDARVAWPYSLYIPKLGMCKFYLLRPKMRLGLKPHVFNGQHYWEINKENYELAKVQRDLCDVSKLELRNTYRVKENPYHRFFVFIRN